MGGTLEASSTLGEGSIFQFDLPLGRVHIPDKEVLEAMKPFWGRSILYLDVGYDKTGAAELMRCLGLNVFVIHTLAEAIKTSNEHSIDIVVLDTVAQVHPLRAHVSLSSVPIVLLTTSGTIQNLHESLAESGISCIYTTPTTLVDLYPPLLTALLLDPGARSDEVFFDILLAEDNLVNRKVVIKLLEGH